MERLLLKNSTINSILKGISQIMLQENIFTGILFLVGIFIGSWQMGVGTLVATTSGTIAAKLLNYKEEEINSGLYGFSAALVGVSLTFLFQATWLIWILVVLGSILSTIIQHYFIKKEIPVFTFPFILVTWVFVFFLRNGIDISPSEAILHGVSIKNIDDFSTSTNGFGEVIFQGNFLSGLIFFIAVYINNPIAALYGLFGSLLGATLSQHYGLPVQSIHLGLFSFNEVLSAIVFAGEKKRDGFWAFLAIFLTWWINILLVETKVLTSFGGVFTFPFVVGTCLTIMIKKMFTLYLTKK